MIDLRVPGSPAACRDTATALRRRAQSLAEVSHDLRRAERTSEEGWQGDAAQAFRATVQSLQVDVGDATADLRRAADGLDAFSAALGSVQHAMQRVRARAVAADVPVTGEAVQPPAADPFDSVAHQTARVLAYERLVVDARQLRELERLAHERLQSLMAGLSPAAEAWLERLGVYAPDHLGVPAVALWAAGLGATMAGASATWLTKARHGRLVSPGRHAVPRAAPHVVGLRAAEPRNWQARPGRSVTHAGWARLGRASNIAGGVFTGGVAALDQWAEDSDRRDLGTGERYVRAGTRGSAAGLGAWGGAWAGAQVGTGVGAAVGSVLPGAGTAVGGAVGGVVGGLAGGVAGSPAGDHFGDWLADRIEWGGEDIEWSREDTVPGTESAGGWR